MKNIAVLGSTGSIGTQTLDVARNNEDIRIVALSAGSNIELLEKQAREFSPEVVSVAEKKDAEKLRKKLEGTGVKVLWGMDGLIEAAQHPSADTVVTAVVGMMGLRPTVAAINAGKDIALANKETLVTAGHIIMPLAKEKNVRILPVDSEHSAILQCLTGEDQREVSRIIITASGGPFRGRTREQMKDVSLEDALKHPNWSMGRKITIDSATMVNKGLEVIEAKWLFGLDAEDIKVIVQPQSVIHSMVEFVDGGIMAQLGTPDMRLPIQYAIYYPHRRPLPGERLDFGALKQITFEEPDFENFRGLALAFEALKTGGSMTTVYNAANELAVSRFLNREIGFLDITAMIEDSMKAHEVIENPDIEQILRTERETYEYLNSRW
ncbi:MAG: 1-deoxy-D-xylulose-5-phosphate reductoisomerase [Clostridia bacterium]|nr:1-deoxy-D-xylulose-5-phosphate reductoisomerase [Clostridia bacterium]